MSTIVKPSEHQVRQNGATWELHLYEDLGHRPESADYYRTRDRWTTYAVREAKKLGATDAWLWRDRVIFIADRRVVDLVKSLVDTKIVRERENPGDPEKRRASAQRGAVNRQLREARERVAAGEAGDAYHRQWSDYYRRRITELEKKLEELK